MAAGPTEFADQETQQRETIELVSVLNEGDSGAINGAAASYACEVEN